MIVPLNMVKHTCAKSFISSLRLLVVLILTQSTLKWTPSKYEVNTQRQRSVLKHERGGGEGGKAHRTRSQAHTSSLMAFALFVCTNKLLCNVYSVQCVRNRLMTMQ